jgi:predicted nucleotidyltransferase
MKRKNLEWLNAHPENIIFKCISGSHAYGTNIETSDTDTRGIFILPEEDILSNLYLEQISDEKSDIVYYELRRFLELLETNNPTVLEILNMPIDCILIKHPIFDEIIKHKDKFLTKKCRNSFGGYAKQQISKATALDKKQNWEESRVTRKNILDFCYVPYGQGSIELTSWLEFEDAYQEYCGLVKIPHMRDSYHLFIGHPGLYSGIMKSKDSNDVSLSSTDKNAKPSTIMVFNKDGYSSHCQDYKEYQEWLTKRNTARYVENKAHGKKIDGKNMLHCKRLLQMAREIAEEKGVIVRRQNAKELIEIRKGINLDDIVKWAEEEIKIVDQLFRDSNLPDKVDSEFITDLLLKCRTDYYNTLK